MKRRFALCLLLLLGSWAMSQNTSARLDDFQRIAIGVKMDKRVYESVQPILESKLSSMVTQNGLGASNEPFFVLEASLNELSSKVTATSPPMFIMRLALSMTISDTKNKYSSSSITIKGIGSSENEAYMSAIEKINIRDRRVKQLFDRGKGKIMAYFNTDCDLYLAKVRALIEAGQTDEATEMLKAVPNVSSECYDNAMTILNTISSSSN